MQTRVFCLHLSTHITAMFSLRTMTIDDYDAVMTLMQQTPGISLRDADSRENIARYLQRNPGHSFVALSGGDIVGCLMSGHDGRRGYLQHLLVHPEHRRLGIANALVERCLATLQAIGIHKSHIDVLKGNEDGAAYWRSQGWQLRTDIERYSFITSDNKNI
jgi:ribosomal protein S18 acetylase RimI-like enzyme